MRRPPSKKIIKVSLLLKMKRQFLPRIIKACIKFNLDKKSNNSTTYINIDTRLKATRRTVISIISEKRTGNPSIEGRSNIKPEKTRSKVYYHKRTAAYSNNHHYHHHHYLHHQHHHHIIIIIITTTTTIIIIKIIIIIIIIIINCNCLIVN